MQLDVYQQRARTTMHPGLSPRDALVDAAAEFLRSTATALGSERIDVQAGAPIATVPYAVLQAMVRHPLTDVGIERFVADSRTYEREPAREQASP